MDNSKILSASLLDLIFDNRNKSYGAYELRKTYGRRVTHALLITGGIAAALIGGALLSNSNEIIVPRKTITVVISDIPEDKPKEVKIKEPEAKTQAAKPTKSEIYVEPRIVKDEDFTRPMAEQDDLARARISDIRTDGPDVADVVAPSEIDGGKDILVPAKSGVPEIMDIVQVQAKFVGNWERFLLRNLDPEVAIEHGAPEGRYTAIVQFVVDLDGSISNITALTSHGYGIEQEAMRVIAKSKKWEPGIQNGYPVKSYRRQPVTFVVESN